MLAAIDASAASIFCGLSFEPFQPKNECNKPKHTFERFAWDRTGRVGGPDDAAAYSSRRARERKPPPAHTQQQVGAGCKPQKRHRQWQQARTPAVVTVTAARANLCRGEDSQQQQTGAVFFVRFVDSLCVLA